MALAWRQIEDAVRRWFLVATDLPGKSVIWSDQNGAQPARPYATLKLIGATQAPGLDELDDTQDLTQAAGSEIGEVVVGNRELTVSCQVFSDSTAAELTAKEYLGNASIALGLPSAVDALNAAGLALIEPGAIQDLSALLETKWQSRAQMDVRFRLTDTATERTGYISTAVPAPTWH